MFKIFLIVLFLAIVCNCQLLRDEERPTRYVLPYAGLQGDEPDLTEEKQYYKPNRRAERIPATAYQYDDDEEYYRPQSPPTRQKIETDNYRYQHTTPSHKDYEEILRINHLARLRVAAKKQQNGQTATPQTPVEQYLKEVNPTTKTSYQKPSNYLRFSQSSIKQDQNEETPIKQQPYRYIYQPELQSQKSYPQYQYETQQEPVKPTPKSTPFNIVAYQNALLAQQKLLAAETHDESNAPSKSPVYVPPTIKKPKKPKTTPRPSSNQQYEYYPQVPPQRAYSPESASRYQQHLSHRNVYHKNENYPNEDSLIYQEQKDVDYPTQAPVRATKQRTTRLPRRKPKYQPEPVEQDEYQPAVSKYQDDGGYDYQTNVKYQDEPTYRRPIPRPTKAPKYEEQDPKDDYLYQPLPKYQKENYPRRPQPHYAPEPELRPRYQYQNRQQYQEESRQLAQYQIADLAYQPTAEVAVRQPGRGPSVSYRQTYPQYQIDRQQVFITPVQPKTHHFNSVVYPNDLTAEQEEEPTIYIPNKSLHLKSQKIYPSTQYKYYTDSQRQINTIKLAPVNYQHEKPAYEVVETPEDLEPEQAATYNYPPIIKLQEQIEPKITTPPTAGKFKPENVIKKKGLHYPRRSKKPTYLNGQSFTEKVRRPTKIQPVDLITQSSSNAPVRYDASRPFVILVYDE